MNIGYNGAAASAAARASLILIFATTLVDKSLSGGNASLITLVATGAEASAAAFASLN